MTKMVNNGRRNNNKAKMQREIANITNTLRRLTARAGMGQASTASAPFTGIAGRNRAPRRRNRRQPARRRRTGGLSPAAKYALSLMYPTHRARPLCGIPHFPNNPSQKIRGFINTSFRVNTSGNGWVAVSPTCASNQNCVFYTGAANSISTFDTNASTISREYMDNLPYAAGGFTGLPNLACRIVSFGVKVFYTGKVLDRSGTYYAYSDPNQSSIAYTGGGLGISDISSRKGCIIRPVDNKPIALNMLPIDEDQLNYGGSATPWKGLGACSLVIAVAGCDSSCTFDVQVTLDCEFIGANVEASTTPNPVPKKSPMPTISQVNEHTRRSNAAGKDISQAVGALAGAAGMNYLMGSASGGHTGADVIPTNTGGGPLIEEVEDDVADVGMGLLM